MGAGGTNQYCWFGRVLLSTNGTGTAPATSGGVIQIFTDYRFPDSTGTNNYRIDVAERWDGYGNNYLYITVNNFFFGGNIKIKVYG